MGDTFTLDVIALADAGLCVRSTLRPDLAHQLVESRVVA